MEHSETARNALAIIKNLALTDTFLKADNMGSPPLICTFTVFVFLPRITANSHEFEIQTDMDKNSRQTSGMPLRKVRWP